MKKMFLTAVLALCATGNAFAETQVIRKESICGSHGVKNQMIEKKLELRFAELKTMVASCSLEAVDKYGSGECALHNKVHVKTVVWPTQCNEKLLPIGDDFQCVTPLDVVCGDAN